MAMPLAALVMAVSAAKRPNAARSTSVSSMEHNLARPSLVQKMGSSYALVGSKSGFLTAMQLRSAMPIQMAY